MSLTFIHIGKNGGGTIIETLRSKTLTIEGKKCKFVFDQNHCKKLSGGNTKYTFFVRDPVTRFISGFLYVLVYYEKSKRFPTLLKYKNKFPTPNDLALALTSDDVKTKQFAYEAMNNVVHIKDNLETYLKSSENIKNHKDKICFVGRFEHFEEDLIKLKKKVGLSHSEGSEIPHYRNMNIYDHMKHLDKKAIENIRQYYHKDYEIIQTLINEGHLPNNYINEITNALFK